jgi:hypothetical protein
MKTINNQPEMQQAVAIRADEKMAVARPASADFDIESVFRYALDKGAGPESMTTLMNIRRELKAEHAKAEFDAAMAALQAELPIIEKRKFGAKNAYKYAPLDDIVSQVQPLLQKHGFSFTVTSEIQNSLVKAICKITHRAGHHDQSEFSCPIDSRNPMMNDPQRYAGSLTFSKRYAFCNAFGIMTGDEDRDGVTERQKPAGPSMAKPQAQPVEQPKEEPKPVAKPVENTDGGRKVTLSAIWGLCKMHDATLVASKDWNAINDFLTEREVLSGVEVLPNLPPERLKEVLSATDKLLNP